MGLKYQKCFQTYPKTGRHGSTGNNLKMWISFERYVVCINGTDSRLGQKKMTTYIVSYGIVYVIHWHTCEEVILYHSPCLPPPFPDGTIETFRLIPLPKVNDSAWIRIFWILPLPHLYFLSFLPFKNSHLHHLHCCCLLISDFSVLHLVV